MGSSALGDSSIASMLDASKSTTGYQSNTMWKSALSSNSRFKSEITSFLQTRAQLLILSVELRLKVTSNELYTRNWWGLRHKSAFLVSHCITFGTKQLMDGLLHYLLLLYICMSMSWRLFIKQWLCARYCSRCRQTAVNMKDLQGDCNFRGRKPTISS